MGRLVKPGDRTRFTITRQCWEWRLSGKRLAMFHGRRPSTGFLRQAQDERVWPWTGVLRQAQDERVWPWTVFLRQAQDEREVGDSVRGERVRPQTESTCSGFPQRTVIVICSETSGGSKLI